MASAISPIHPSRLSRPLFACREVVSLFGTVVLAVLLVAVSSHCFASSIGHGYSFGRNRFVPTVTWMTGNERLGFSYTQFLGTMGLRTGIGPLTSHPASCSVLARADAASLSLCSPWLNSSIWTPKAGTLRGCSNRVVDSPAARSTRTTFQRASLTSSVSDVWITVTARPANGLNIVTAAACCSGFSDLTSSDFSSSILANLSRSVARFASAARAFVSAIAARAASASSSAISSALFDARTWNQCSTNSPSTPNVTTSPAWWISSDSPTSPTATMPTQRNSIPSSVDSRARMTVLSKSRPVSLSIMALYVVVRLRTIALRRRARRLSR